MKSIKTQVSELPNLPGVYQLCDEKENIVYIGKAINLRKRVSSYFNSTPKYGKHLKLKENVKIIKYIETESETEALILEANLVKEHQPKYNVLLRDDKQYVYVRASVQEDFPRIHLVRKVERDGAKYFGPKTSSKSIKETLNLLRKIFPYRTCKMGIKCDGEKIKLTNKDRRVPCLDYHIRRCDGACLGKIDSENYKKNIEAICNFLAGDEKSVTSILEEEIQKLSAELKFERAMRVRDQLLAIQKISENQKVDEAGSSERDVIAFVSEGKKHYFNIFLIRNGKLIDRLNFTLKGEDEECEILQAFLTQYYAENTDVPSEILVPTECENAEVFEKFLTNKKGKKVTIKTPQKGKKSRLLEMARTSAQNYCNQSKASFENTDALADLQEVLNLEKKPKRIEAYDISHHGGSQTVASMVVAKNGKPDSSLYRHFRIKLLEDKEINDYLSLSETLFRRNNYLLPQVPDVKIRTTKSTKNIPQTQSTFVYKNKKYEKIETHKCILIEKNKELVGTACLFAHDEKNTEIGSIWVDEKYRGVKLGHHLLTHAIKQIKQPKAYISAKNELVEYYSEFGFKICKKTPQVLTDARHFFCTKHAKASKENIFMVLDLKNYTPDKSFATIPDLVVIDGGKGQLSSVLKNAVFHPKTTVISLSKSEETIHLPDGSEIQLDAHSPARLLLQRMRDESHRFANKYRENLQSKKMFE